MKKFIYAALLTGTALGFAAGAHAEGDAAINSKTQLNTDAAASSADNSVAHGTVQVNDNSISATSTTGTPEGTASGTIARDNSANGINAEGQVGTRNGDDEAAANANANASANTNASEEAKVSEDMSSKTGTMKTRAKGAMGMLNPDEIKTVQSNLKQAGYRVSVDGVWGQQTKAALKEYQKAKQLNVSGKVDADTRSSLGLPAATTSAEDVATPDSNKY